MIETDIVVFTCERLSLLKRTLEYIWDRTRTPYRLHILDDASLGGNAAYIQGLEAQGKVASASCRKQRLGVAANLRALLSITQSDPIIVTDDDVLCPDVEPDWLARELAIMVQSPGLGILSLNNPQATTNTRYIERGPEMTRYGNVGAVFAMIRRAVLKAVVTPDGPVKPMKYLCSHAIQAGFDVGCLTDTYCQHIGIISVRIRRRDYSAKLRAVYPTNKKTLEPPDVYKI